MYRRAEGIESDVRLDAAAKRLDPIAARLASAGAIGGFLKGRWLGHSFHPMATDFPLGSWMSASLLDLIGGEGSRPAARKLVGFGILMAVPTAAAGLVDWSETRDGAWRVGVAHAGANTTAVLLYTLSFVARSKARHRAGAALGLLGGLTATVGGYFGGHLSLEKGVGVNVERAAADAETVSVIDPCSSGLED